MPESFIHSLREQAIVLGVDDRLEAHAGVFRETFERVRGSDLHFSFGHIDANLYESTLDACRFVLPRIAAGGAVVFDDYHGPCDLGARLAIDSYLAKRGLRPNRLSGSSACLWL